MIPGPLKLPIQQWGDNEYCLGGAYLLRIGLNIKKQVQERAEAVKTGTKELIKACLRWPM